MGGTGRAMAHRRRADSNIVLAYSLGGAVVELISVVIWNPHEVRCYVPMPSSGYSHVRPNA